MKKMLFLALKNLGLVKNYQTEVKTHMMKKNYPAKVAKYRYKTKKKT